MPYLQHIALTIFLSVSLFRPWPADGEFLRPVLMSVANALENITVAILGLFCLLVRTAVILLDILDHKLANDLSLMKNEALLEEWRRMYGLICLQLVHQINKSFGLVLLVGISSIFVSFITDSFALTAGLRYDDDSLSVHFSLLLIKNALLLGMITCGPCQFRSKVYNIS